MVMAAPAASPISAPRFCAASLASSCLRLDVYKRQAVDSVPNQIARLEQKTCDAIVVNRENTPGYLATHPDFKVIEFADGEGFTLGFNGSCVGLRKSDTELLDQVNASLAGLSEEARAEILAAANERQPK